MAGYAIALGEVCANLGTAAYIDWLFKHFFLQRPVKGYSLFERSVAEPLRSVHLAFPAECRLTRPLISGRLATADDIVLDFVHSALHEPISFFVPCSPFKQLRRIVIHGEQLNAFGDPPSLGPHFDKENIPDRPHTSPTLGCVVGSFDSSSRSDRLITATRPESRRSFYLHLDRETLRGDVDEYLCRISLPQHIRHLGVSFPPFFEWPESDVMDAACRLRNSIRARRIEWVIAILTWVKVWQEGPVIVELIGAWCRWNTAGSVAALKGKHDGLHRTIQVDVKYGTADQKYNPAVMCGFKDRSWKHLLEKMSQGGYLGDGIPCGSLAAAVDMYTWDPEDCRGSLPYDVPNEQGKVLVVCREIEVRDACPCCGLLLACYRPFRASCHRFGRRAAPVSSNTGDTAAVRWRVIAEAAPRG